jgi:glycopeptide antibiotics resistance protein
MKKNFTAFYYFLIMIGVVGIIVTLGYDFFRPGEPNFGEKQFMGFIGSILILLVGLRKSSRSKNYLGDYVSLFIYIAGMSYLVLKPDQYAHHSHFGMLVLTKFYATDVSLNVFGFIPLGYLLMSIFTRFTGEYKQTTTILVILLVGFLLSFSIEIGQYFIPGRTSSLNDVAANGTGDLIGILLFLVDSAFTQKVG